MAPINMKPAVPRSATKAMKSSAASSQDARLLVRETIRISANLASSGSPSTLAPPPLTVPALQLGQSSKGTGLIDNEFVDSSFRVICCEEVDGCRWKYLAVPDGGSQASLKSKRKASIRAVSLQSPQNPLHELVSFVRSYVVPEGFPDSVPPCYVPYMSWRALKHFFGGSMGVFTTQTLLSSVGISRETAATSAVAFNWILKDGAGRVGKMIFSRQGKKFDYDLKQVEIPFKFDVDSSANSSIKRLNSLANDILSNLRFSGDLLMELGAGVELATAAMPHLFLPLACAASVLKNVGAVTSTSTRTPIYKAFATGENIGDVTAKGECVGNIADLLGTGLGIIISKRSPSLFTTFSLLSCGYVFSSYQEVRSVVLRTLNRARFTVAVESFLNKGYVPSLQEGNMKEKIFTSPWVKDRPIVLGPRFKDAFQDPGSYFMLEPLFEKERYIVTYNPAKGQVYALLKDQAKSDDVLKAAFHGHVLLHSIRTSVLNKQASIRTNEEADALCFPGTPMDIEVEVAESCKVVSATYGLFKDKAAQEGWLMSESHLNPGRARLISCSTPL